MDETTLEQIRLRAYQLSQSREQVGRPGDPESDWLEAEREILHAPDAGGHEPTPPRPGRPAEQPRRMQTR